MKSIIGWGAVALLCVVAGPARAQEVRRVDGECIARNMRVPRDLRPHLPDRVDVWFEVAADGAVGELRIAPEAASERIAKLIEASVRQCARSIASAPAPARCVVTVRFAS